ncbi:16S rRNA (cytidine(1402)-2'-O)-methyltransferase [Spiroplasma taiwanense]|uniref:Methyltransferase n=1 Tax=Spiroplasma taiwanense CT-1 TaxID=1276220 RepID=S5LWC8_9MOLU|nr:16S rRNA (cytidine(1402)-2'-O)-methyltransferase [Spiroplasma taiwanense]AGR40921.1 methyltransferase [Spiroplasma taiwanense CT-1]
MKIQKTFRNQLSTIYLVGTPIGNLEDVSTRVIKTLNESDVIYCEDTRVSLKLFEKLNIKKKLKSLHKFNELLMVNEILNDIKIYNKISIISDAGVPCISDPGALVISKILNSNVDLNITSINCGPAYIHAIVSSGFVASQNLFLGFLDKKNIQKNLVNYLNNFKNSNILITFYESVHRIESSLNLLSTILEDDTNIVIAKELTKINEEYIRGEIIDVCKYISSTKFTKKGEFCIIINPNYKLKNEIEIDMKKIIFEVNKLILEKYSKKDAIKIISKKYSINKNELTKIFYK